VQKRLRKQDFLQVLKTGKQTKSQTMRVFFRESTLPTPRLGIIVDKRVSSRAVDRNRLRRVLRDVFYKVRCQLIPYDIVIKIQKKYSRDIEEQSKQELTEFLGKLFQ
jgi:ribonuclease P protein component